MRRLSIITFLTLVFLPALVTLAAATVPALQIAHIYPADKASLQRGAGLYMNYCSGCHSLQYMRYQRLADDLSIPAKLVQDNLIFSEAKLGDPIKSNIFSKDAEAWFGVAPPDLTLIAKIRGVDWLYTYLHSFYQDDNRPWGTNNLLFPEVAMPHVLVSLQGVQQPVYSRDNQYIIGLKLIKPGQLSQREYDQVINDLVNFLAYTAAPEKLERQDLGIRVLLFLAIFAILAYLLKRVYWQKFN